MALTFTLHKLSQGLHWYISKPIGSPYLTAIKDPQGGNLTADSSTNLSPLANMERVRMAFQHVADHPNLLGTSVA